MKAVIALCLVAFSVQAEDWYWLPYQGGAHYGAGTGATYVDAWGQDSKIGWASMAAGDVLYVCGKHDKGAGDRQIIPTKDGITISGACPNDPGSIIPGNVKAVILEGRQSMTVADLTISGCYIGIEVKSVTAAAIRNVTITDCTSTAIAVTAASNGEILGNTLQRVANGIYLHGAGQNNWRIDGNHISDISGSGDSHGIGLQSCVGCEITRNVVRRANSGITAFRIGQGQIIDTVIADNVLTDFMVVAAGSSGIRRGIELTSANCPSNPEWTRNVTIRGNLIERAGDGAIYIKTVEPSGEQNWSAIVEGNTVRDSPIALRYASPRTTESKLLFPWFPVSGNDWGGGSVYRLGLDPGC